MAQIILIRTFLVFKNKYPYRDTVPLSVDVKGRSKGHEYERRGEGVCQFYLYLICTCIVLTLLQVEHAAVPPSDEQEEGELAQR